MWLQHVMDWAAPGMCPTLCQRCTHLCIEDEVPGGAELLAPATAAPPVVPALGPIAHQRAHPPGLQIHLQMRRSPLLSADERLRSSALTSGCKSLQLAASMKHVMERNPEWEEPSVKCAWCQALNQTS